MDWIMEPLNGFKGIGPVEAEACSHTWIQCGCQGGLLQCTTPGALVVNPEEPN